MADTDFKTLSDDQLINYCKDNNIIYLNKQNKVYSRKTLLTNIKNNKTIIIDGNGNGNGNDDIDIKLNSIINACHNKLYKASISGFKALNDIMNIFILVLLQYVFKSNPHNLEDLIETKTKERKLILTEKEIDEFKVYLLDINKFIQKFEIINNFTSIWRNYIIFLAALFPSLYDKDDTKFNCKEERIIVDVFKTISSLSKDIDDNFINDLSIKHGNIYEYFIGYCGKNENSKAFGQFFTPKPFINAILNDCGFKEMIDNLEIENPTLYDPAMGSGGLLGLTYTTCKDKIKPNDIYGCEIEKDTMRYGESSILITTKLFNNNLIRCNTLDRNTNPYLRDNKKFNIIVSNPPFGTQTNYKDLIPDEYRDDKKYKDEIYPISTTGEKLFIQNIIYLLADGGICALILPDGELMTKNDTNKTIRKFILDNCKIIKIIEVENGVFKHTNIKTKVLILKKQKQDNYDYEIDYMNINKKCQTTLIKKLILNDDYQFTIKTNDYNDIFSDNPDIEIKTLGEVCEFINGPRKKSKDAKTEGLYPLYYCSILGNLYLDTYDYVGNGIIINKTNGSGKSMVYYGSNKYNVGETTFHFKSKSDETIKTKYIYYILLTNKEVLEQYYNGLNQKSINDKDLFSIKIPIPSLEQQEEVIKTIEDINELIDYRKTLKENQTKEKKYLLDDIKRRYLKKSIIKTLGEVCNFKNGKSIIRKDLIDGEYPVIGGGQKPMGYHNKYNVAENSILCSSSGAYAGYISKYNIKVWASDCFSIIPKIDNLNNDYLYYYLKSLQEKIYNLQDGSAQPHIYSSTINKIKIPIPSLDQQTEFIREVEELNMTYEKLEKDNNNIIEQLENIKKDTFKF